MPYEITEQSTVKATYTYLADGTKAGAVDDNGVGFEYLGSMVYNNNNGTKTLESSSFGGGRINKTSSNKIYDINYFITDHLGSTRVIVNPAGDILEQNDYYPFGLKHDNPNLVSSGNRYRFVGEELQVIGLVGDIDLGARNYDSFTGRLRTQDLLAETKYPLSSYSYAANNPIYYIDWLGLDTVPASQVDWSTFNPEQDVMALDEVTVTARKPLTQAEANELVRTDEWFSYMNTHRLSNSEQGMIGAAFVYVGQERFLSSPYTQYSITALTSITGVESIVFLSSLAKKFLKKLIMKQVAKQATKGGTKLYSEATYKALERQFEKDGMKSILKTQSRIQKNLAEHIRELAEIKKAGGYYSSVEREIKTFQSQLDAIKDLLK